MFMLPILYDIYCLMLLALFKSARLEILTLSHLGRDSLP
jgi:hypothetical protein